MKIHTTNTRYSAWRNILMNIMKGGALVVIISSVSLLGGCEYTCAAGTASSNDFQLFDAPERCVACDDGYTLDNRTCVANSYTCANGTAAADGTAGGSDGDAICAICDDGYVLENNACRRAIYTCDGGTAVTDDNPDSGTDDVEQCAECNPGFVPVASNRTCRKAEFTCDNGIRAGGNPTTGNSDVPQCAECNPGYHRDDVACNINTYTCFNGMSVPNGTPGIDGTEWCAMCSPGFALVSADNTCADDSDGDSTPDIEDVDDDNDGLIEIDNLDMLHNIRWNLEGTTYDDEEDDGTGNGGDTTGALTASHPDNNCATATDGVYLCGYELTRSLDFAVATDYANGNINNDWRPTTGDPPTVTDPATATNVGWPGIGVGETIFFSAIFDGNGNTISNLYRRDASDVGFFNDIAAVAVVRNIGIASGNVYGTTGTESVGGLAGRNLGVIVSSYASAHVDGVGNSMAAGSADNVGGLVGVNINTGIVIASYATGNVVSNDNMISNIRVGGLVGTNSGNAIIIASYATGSADGSSGAQDNVGGLVGWNNGGTIVASYATGTADGGSGSGDLVGALVGRNSSSATITASYGFGTASNGTVFDERPSDDDFEGTALTLQISDTTTAAAATYAGAAWNSANDDTAGAWDVGSTSQAPALRYADYDGDAGIDYSCDMFPATVVCGTTLLPGQRME